MHAFQKLLCIIGKTSEYFIARNISFKVLKYDINLNSPEMKNAEMKSVAVNKFMSFLSKSIKAGGGHKAVHRHTIINKKLLVRERLKLLFDSDFPFLEIGLLAGMFMDYGNIPAAGTVAGIGKIHGHFCIVGANDATVKGGTFFPITVAKQSRIHQLSYLNKLPCIYLVDSGGAFLPLQAEIFPDKNHGGRAFYHEAVLSSLKIPQICMKLSIRINTASAKLKKEVIAIVCGSSTAGGAYCPTMAEEAIIVKDTGVIFLAGPPLVKAATGEIVTEQELGGADLHCSISGCTDFYAENEEEAFELCRESVLTWNLSTSTESKVFDDPLYPAKDLTLISGKETLNKEDMYLVLSRLLDGSMFKEFKGKFGENLITGFGFLKNKLVGILTNCNSLSFKDAQKGAHFIQLCEKRNVPLCFIQNSGNPDEDLVGDETYDCLKNRAKMITAHCHAKVPKITLCVGGCYADDNFTMCGWDFKPNFFLSWPLTHISPSRNVISKIKSEEANALNNLLKSKEFDDYENLFYNSSSIFHKSSRMLCDIVINPEDTREVLGMCLDIVSKT